MKKIVTICVGIYMSTALFAQNHVSIQYMPTLATFKYTDSNGEADPNMRSVFKSNIGVSYSHVFPKGVFIRPEIAIKNLGATSMSYANKLEWTLSYLDLNVGLGYIKHFKAIGPYIGGAPYISYLHKATQAVGENYYDLISNGIKKSDFGLNLFAGIRFRISETVAFFVEARQGIGLNQLETSTVSGGTEKLYNRAMSFNVGISFNLFDKHLARRTNF